MRLRGTAKPKLLLVSRRLLKDDHLSGSIPRLSESTISESPATFSRSQISHSIQILEVSGAAESEVVVDVRQLLAFEARHQMEVGCQLNW